MDIPTIPGVLIASVDGHDKVALALLTTPAHTAAPASSAVTVLKLRMFIRSASILFFLVFFTDYYFLQSSDFI